MTNDSPDEPPNGLELHKEKKELSEKVEALMETIENQDTKILGLEKANKEFKSQMEKFAITLGVANDYPTLLGEMEKLICVEDKLEDARTKIRALQGEDNHEVAKVIVEGEKAVEKMTKEVSKKEQEIKQLKSKRNVDKYRAVELAKETMRKFFKDIIKKIKGVIKRGNS